MRKLALIGFFAMLAMLAAYGVQPYVLAQTEAVTGLPTIDGAIDIRAGDIPLNEMTLLGRLADPPAGYAYRITLVAMQGRGVFIGVGNEPVPQAIHPQTVETNMSGAWRPFSNAPGMSVTITALPQEGFRYLYVGSQSRSAQTAQIVRNMGFDPNFDLPEALPLYNVTVRVEVVPLAEHDRHQMLSGRMFALEHVDWERVMREHLDSIIHTPVSPDRGITFSPGAGAPSSPPELRPPEVAAPQLGVALPTMRNGAEVRIPYIPAGEMTLVARLGDAPEGYAWRITVEAEHGRGLFAGVRDAVVYEAIAPRTAPSVLSGEWRPFSNVRSNTVTIVAQPHDDFRHLYVGAANSRLENVTVRIEVVSAHEYARWIRLARSVLPALPTLPPLPALPPMPATDHNSDRLRALGLPTIRDQATFMIPHIPAGEMTLLARLEDAPDGYARRITVEAERGHGLFVGVRDVLLLDAMSPHRMATQFEGAWRPLASTLGSTQSITAQPYDNFRYLYVGSTGGFGFVALENVHVRIETIPANLREWRLDPMPDLRDVEIHPQTSPMPRLITIEPITTIEEFMAAEEEMRQLGYEMSQLGVQMQDLGAWMRVHAAAQELDALRRVGDDMNVLGTIMGAHGEIMAVLGREMSAFQETMPVSMNRARRIALDFIDVTTPQWWAFSAAWFTILDGEPVWRFDWGAADNVRYSVVVNAQTGAVAWACE